jgi:hypothetical protein
VETLDRPGEKLLDITALRLRIGFQRPHELRHRAPPLSRYAENRNAPEIGSLLEDSRTFDFR